MRMRWESLFDDLEGQLEQELIAEDAQLRAEEERLRLGRLTLRSRLSALATAQEGTAGVRAPTRPLHLELRSGSIVGVLPLTFGKDWLAGELLAGLGRNPQCVVPFWAIGAVLLDREPLLASLVEQDAPARLAERIGLPFVLRDLCRRRAAVSVDCAGRASDGSAVSVHGTIDRVGRDHCDLAVHEPHRPRRERLVTGYRIIPLEQIMLVRVSGAA